MTTRADLERRVDELAAEHSGQAFAGAVTVYADTLDPAARQVLGTVCPSGQAGRRRSSAGSGRGEAGSSARSAGSTATARGVSRIGTTWAFGDVQRVS